MTAPTLERVDQQSTESGHVAHIVISRDPNKTGVQVVTEARVYGLPVEALCGQMFVPSRDPKHYPLCQACKEIREATGKGTDELGRA